jgi:aspartyl protease family protein
LITNNIMLGSVYILMAMMLVVGALISRRERPVKLLTMGLAWIAIFAAGFVLFTFRDDFGWVMQRLRAEATGDPVTQGEEVRVPMSIDGHFWVEAEVNGAPVRFLVDSGATMTTIGRSTAARAGISPSSARDQIVRTGNGLVRMQTGRADTVAVGPIERDNVLLHVAGSDDLNVLGMNFLSSLQRWGVEGRWLILVP